ncbi:MAG: hypothetical protein A2806_00445 [Candidatus Terrybacteria bacterium RIFCSPHIGHO2_01_FULL_48_17]|uniref:EfeO-type cupredoxin-like domain-containing protein n=1 Tax=Candidatus Terrybacteria bacterium RIFCSPHIGHO2_01_FULL_48_17 TaxID=1802362 RepID=A0A1G2PJV7_9BACT|nr:MAG: hypothetical protein A2806_00445 [Candidatus Terrybacteria bacterium RIFCSPHIGHO2_01_FULL_48_17]OHA53681.1 MAG: hypothetical protein A3A30_00765 [Candidatus Terrybacteria bacterium RIFCSPLOWO2_01_FULL_48_14]
MNSFGKYLLFIGLGVVILIAIGVFLLSGGESGTPQPKPTLPLPESSSPTLSGEGAVVVITESGFEPQTLTVPNGTTVTFRNETSRNVWPASNIHPTHTQYPGSGLHKCGSAEEPQIFDACHGLAPGESYLFTFTVSGTHQYHDHLFPTVAGQIMVE